MDPAQVLRQTSSNVDFLVKHKHISAEDGKALLDKLAACQESLSTLTRQSRGALSSQASGSSGPSSSSGSARGKSSSPSDNFLDYRTPPTPPVPILRVRAKWDWNHVNPNPNDLSFFKGDVFQLLEETNENWYTGKHFGSDRQGTFPANYVEKLPSVVENREPARPPLQATNQQVYDQPRHDGYNQLTAGSPNYSPISQYNATQTGQSATYGDYLPQQRIQPDGYQSRPYYPPSDPNHAANSPYNTAYPPNSQTYVPLKPSTNPPSKSESPQNQYLPSSTTVIVENSTPPSRIV